MNHPPTPNVMRGLGWALVDASPYASTPGMHDLGTQLGVQSMRIGLIVLRAAERWTPHYGEPEAQTALVHRAGQLRVDYTRGPALRLDETTQFLSIGQQVVGLTNVGTELAQVLMIAPAGPHRSDGRQG